VSLTRRRPLTNGNYPFEKFGWIVDGRGGGFASAVVDQPLMRSIDLPHVADAVRVDSAGLPTGARAVGGDAFVAVPKARCTRAEGRDSRLRTRKLQPSCVPARCAAMREVAQDC